MLVGSCLDALLAFACRPNLALLGPSSRTIHWLGLDSTLLFEGLAVLAVTALGWALHPLLASVALSRQNEA